MTEDERVGWHHRFNGHEFEQALGVGVGQESLVCGCVAMQRVGHDWVIEQQQQGTLLAFQKEKTIAAYEWP